MKYYLETNALRALGSKLGKNKELLSSSFTSLFSLFELIKGIDRAKDSEKRKNILKNLSKLEIPIIELMPTEMIQRAFINEINASDSEEIKRSIGLVTLDISCEETLSGVTNKYEEATKKFQEKMIVYAVPAPPPKKITIKLEDMFADPDPDSLAKISHLPKDCHPSQVFIELIKKNYVVPIYRSMISNEGETEDEILSKYNGRLDLFFFAERMFTIKKQSLRQSSSKNDLLDILHVVYLHSPDIVIVSDDKIFRSILPEKNVTSVEEYRKLI